MESPKYELARVIETHAEQYMQAVMGGALAYEVCPETRTYVQGLRDAAKLVRGEPVRLPAGEE